MVTIAPGRRRLLALATASLTVPDLAGAALGSLDIPVLLIVGELDTEVLQLNEQARQALGEPCELLVIPGATHLFDEPGTLEEASKAAAGWFHRQLVQP